MSNINIDYKEFEFGGLTSFLQLDVVASIIGLAKAYRDIDPIPNSSIMIHLNDSLMGSSMTQMLSSLLQSGTKPLNAIMYMHAKDDHNLNKVFKVVKSNESNVENQIVAIKYLVASLVIFISRGQLPATQGNNSNTPLPKFITNIMKISLKTENDLKNAIMDFDPKHVNLKPLFSNPDNFKGWDQILQNRFMLGVAGHKPLKAIDALYQYLDQGRKEEEGFKILEAIHTASKNGVNGFYPSLHPAIQTFSTTYNQFYRNFLKLVLSYMVGTEPERHKRMMDLPMFKPDKFVKDELLNHHLSIAGWTGHQILTDLGQPIKFGDAKGITIEKTKLQFGQSKPHSVREDVEEEESDDNTKSGPSTTTIKEKPKKTSKKYGEFEQNV